jgi:Zn-finger nucleic acid-binding protein
MKCPNCGETLVMADRQGVEIDYCPKCRGVWLDKGELDKIIERSAQYDSGSGSSSGDTGYDQRRDYDDDYNKKRQNPQRKKRGFLGDMFDFD